MKQPFIYNNAFASTPYFYMPIAKRNLFSILLSFLLLTNAGCATYVGTAFDGQTTEQLESTGSDQQSKQPLSNSSASDEDTITHNKNKTTNASQQIIEYLAGFVIGYLLAGLLF